MEIERNRKPQNYILCKWKKRKKDEKKTVNVKNTNVKQALVCGNKMF